MTVKKFFKKGSFFGDYETFKDQPCYYEYKANKDLRVICIPKHKFIKLIDEYPILKERFIKSAK